MGVLKKNEREELFRALHGHEIIEKEVFLSWDGSNLILRLPKDIASYLGINKNNRFKKAIKFRIEEGEENIKKEFDVVDRDKPKRKTKNEKK